MRDKTTDSQNIRSKEDVKTQLFDKKDVTKSRIVKELEEPTRSASTFSVGSISSSNPQNSKTQEVLTSKINREPIIHPRFPPSSIPSSLLTSQKPDFSTARLLVTSDLTASKLSSFLAEMKASNAELASKVETREADIGFEIVDLNAEDECEDEDEVGEQEVRGNEGAEEDSEDGGDQDDEGEYIEMNLGLGVLEERPLRDDGHDSDSDDSSAAEIGVEDFLRRLKDIQGTDHGDGPSIKDKKKTIIEEVFDE